MKNLRENQKEETHQIATWWVLAEREARPVRVGLARTDAPSDHAVDLDRLDPLIGGEQKSTAQMRVRVDPHRRAGSDVHHEEFARRVRENP